MKSFAQPATYFASPERVSQERLDQQIELSSKNPFVDSLLMSVHGLVAVLNENRQIVALNDTYLRAVGGDRAEDILGLRPGESLRCIYASEMTAGCGTSQYCSTCGAAIAIVSAMTAYESVEKKCAVTIHKNGKAKDVCFSVKATPLTVEDEKYLLLFLRDITKDEMRVALERTFFHDIRNILVGLIGNSEMLRLKGDARNLEWISKISFLSSRLATEIELHRALLHDEKMQYSLKLQNVSIDQIVKELRELLSHHPAAKQKILRMPSENLDETIQTDLSLLLRVLNNMLINALEATPRNGVVKMWFEQGIDGTTFHVWNAQHIPEEIARRIFQCHFTTKKQDGRGIGTYAMKLLGENLLGGRVDFSSSEEKGTDFFLFLPCK